MCCGGEERNEDVLLPEEWEGNWGESLHGTGKETQQVRGREVGKTTARKGREQGRETAGKGKGNEMRKRRKEEGRGRDCNVEEESMVL